MGEFDYQTQNLKMKDVPTAKGAAEALKDPYTNFVHVGTFTRRNLGDEADMVEKMDVRWCKGFFSWSAYYGGILVKSVCCFLFMYTVYGCLLYSVSVCMYYWQPESGWVRSVYVIPRWWLNVVYKCLNASRHPDLCFLSSWGKCGFQNRAVVWLYPDHTGDSSFSPFLMANGECNRLATQFLDQHDESAECVAVYRVKSPEWGSAALMLFQHALRYVSFCRSVGWKR